MKFYFHITSPDQKSKDRSFIRSVTAFTLDDTRELGRPAYLNLKLKMTYMKQGIEIIKEAIEEKVGETIELYGAYPLC